MKRVLVSSGLVLLLSTPALAQPGNLSVAQAVGNVQNFTTV